MQTSVLTALVIAFAGMLADLVDKTVGSFVNRTKKTQLLTITAKNNTLYTVTINGTAFSYTSDSTATAAEIRNALITLINAGTEPVTASASGNNILLVNDEYETDYTLAVTSELAISTQIGFKQTVEFGLFVCKDSLADNVCRLPFQATDITGGFGGVALHTHNVEQSNPTSGNVGYPYSSMINLLSKGRVYVQVEEAVTAGDAVYVRYAVGTGSKIGAFRKSEDSSTAGLLPSSRYITSADANGFAVVEINLP